MAKKLAGHLGLLPEAHKKFLKRYGLVDDKERLDGQNPRFGSNDVPFKDKSRRRLGMQFEQGIGELGLAAVVLAKTAAGSLRSDNDDDREEETIESTSANARRNFL